MADTSHPATTLQMLGAGGFGALIGWYVYYINRYRKGDVQLSDLVTLIGAVGGSAVLVLFPQGSDLFGAYGIGLFAGFFSYLLMLIALVAKSPNFNSDWFLDGRRKKPVDPYDIPGDQRPMGVRGNTTQ
jgi:H+/Cl- antiporter ClcA